MQVIPRRWAAVAGAAAGGATAGLLAGPAPASAHEKWFVDEPGSYPTDWAFVLRPVTLGLIIAVVLMAALWRYVAVRYLPTPELPQLGLIGRIVPYVPRLLAIHLGVSLLAAADPGAARRVRPGADRRDGSGAQAHVGGHLRDLRAERARTG